MAERNGNGMRPEYKAKLRRKQIFGVIKALIGMALLGAIIGLVLVHKDYLLALFEKKSLPPSPEVATARPVPAQRTESAKVSEKSPVPPVIPPTPSQTKTALPPVEDVVPSGEEQQTQQMIAQGQALLEKLQFREAASLFQQAAGRKCGAKLRKEAQSWERKAQAFDLATRHIPVSEFAVAPTTCIVQMRDGRELCGLVRNETADMIELEAVPAQNPATFGRSRFPLPKSDIQKDGIIRVSLKERQAEFDKLVQTLYAGATFQRSSDFYDLVFLCKRLGLGKQCLAFLNRAYDGSDSYPPDPYLGDSFRKEVVRREIDRAATMLASGRDKAYVEDVLRRLVKTLPGFDVAMDEADAFRVNCMAKVRADFKSTLRQLPKGTAVAEAAAQESSGKAAPSARELVRSADKEETVEVVVVNEGVQGQGGAAPIVDQANAKYEEGVKMFQHFRQGTNGDNNRVLREALKKLTEAIDLYDQALQKDPNNKAVSDRQTEANMMAYSCRKYQTL